MQKDATNIEAIRLEEADVAPEKIKKAIDEDGAPLATAEPNKRPGRPRTKKAENGEKSDSTHTPEKEAYDVSAVAPKKRTSTKKTTKKNEKSEPAEPTEAIEKADEGASAETAEATDAIEAAETVEVAETVAVAENIIPDTAERDKPSDEDTLSVEDMPAVTESLCTVEHEIAPLMNVEHFSDYRSRDSESHEEDPITSPLIIPVSECKDDLPDDVVEYENLTILDDELEPTDEKAEIEEALPENESAPESKWIKTRWDEVKYDPEKPRRVDARFELLELFVFTLAVIMLLSTFIFRHSVVEGRSTEGTLHDGEYLVISDLFYTPKRGDIIVCADYTTGLEKPIVKRIIAVGGETVSITRNGEIYVNGELLVEDYVYIDEEGYTYRPMVYTVPEGEVFVMGDHRNQSTDSRAFGAVKEDAILGRVLIRFLPLEKFGKVK